MSPPGGLRGPKKDEGGRRDAGALLLLFVRDKFNHGCEAAGDKENKSCPRRYLLYAVMSTCRLDLLHNFPLMAKLPPLHTLNCISLRKWSLRLIWLDKLSFFLFLKHTRWDCTLQQLHTVRQGGECFLIWNSSHTCCTLPLDQQFKSASCHNSLHYLGLLHHLIFVKIKN